MLCCMIWENIILLIYYGMLALSSLYLQKTRSRAETRVRKRIIERGKENRVRRLRFSPDASGKKRQRHTVCMFETENGSVSGLFRGLLSLCRRFFLRGSRSSFLCRSRLRGGLRFRLLCGSRSRFRGRLHFLLLRRSRSRFRRRLRFRLLRGGRSGFNSRLHFRLLRRSRSRFRGRLRFRLLRRSRSRFRRRLRFRLLRRSRSRFNSRLRFRLLRGGRLGGFLVSLFPDGRSCGFLLRFGLGRSSGNKAGLDQMVQDPVSRLDHAEETLHRHGKRETEERDLFVMPVRIGDKMIKIKVSQTA